MHQAVITWVIAQMHTQNDVEIFPSGFPDSASASAADAACPAFHLLHATLSLSSVLLFHGDFLGQNARGRWVDGWFEWLRKCDLGVCSYGK